MTTVVVGVPDMLAADDGATATGDARTVLKSEYRKILPSGATLTEAAAQLRTDNWTTSNESIDIALYDVTDVDLTAEPEASGAPRLALVTLNPGDNVGAGVITSKSANIDLSAYAGREVFVALGNPTNTSVRIFKTDGVTNDSSRRSDGGLGNNLPDPWESNNLSTYIPHIQMTVEGSTGPSISSITDSGTTADQITENENATVQLDQDATVTGAELQNEAGDRVATLSIQSSTSDSVEVQGARGALRYGDADNKVVVTLDDDSTIEYTGITLNAPNGFDYINGNNLDTTSDNSFGKDLTNPPSEYQLAWSDPFYNDPDKKIDPDVNSDSTVNSIENPGNLNVELYDNVNGVWGNDATFSMELDGTVKITGVERAAVNTPKSIPTITNITTNKNKVTIEFDHNLSDVVSSYEVQFDDGKPQVINYPKDTFRLRKGTYTVKIRPANSHGRGRWSDLETFEITDVPVDNFSKVKTF